MRTKLHLNPSKKYLLACSFGPDSMALLSLLIKGKYDFFVAHVNYGLRPEAKSETKQLAEFCEYYKIPLHIHEVKEKISSNVEEKCREIRYQFFSDLCNILKTDFVLVGHHEDDVLETFIMQKKRKNLVNYYGIKKESIVKGVKIIRPLLNYRKIDLTNYCLENDIPFAVDSTNLTNQYYRNLIRHEIVEKMNDMERDALLNEMQVKNTELAALKKKVEVDLANRCDFLKNLDNLELAYSLAFLGRKVKPDFEISFSCVQQIRKCLESEKPNIEMKVNGLLFKKTYGVCCFTLTILPSDYHFLMESPSLLDTPFFFADFRKEYSNRKIKIEDFPIEIRNPNKDDETYIKGYKVKIRRLFIDWKMPIDLRSRWPVIVNKDGMVIYVPRYRIDFSPTKNENFYVK
ncbi:MAG TPA: tRNA lysidine(34) synthetase TilS [Bacilli bacterium]|nr:tRNA lysidine(34) synthetase TilS [Bacilli bacterium]HQA55963.1 tRNA lysidine(34) synthetase TilS [Bacilli bacterium]